MNFESVNIGNKVFRDEKRKNNVQGAIMKRLLILTMMCALIGSMVALESDPSEVVGYVKYECVTTTTTDMNLVSVALDNGVTTAQDLAAEIGAAGVVDAVSKWDEATQSWQQVTYSFIPVPPPGGFAWSGNFDIVNGDVLAVNVTSDVDYYCAGSIPADPVYNLITTTTTDANLVMLPLSMSSLSNAQDLANDIGAAGDVDAVSSWDAATQSWQQVTYSFIPVPPPGGYAWSGNFDIEIGKGYMINMTTNTTWPSDDLNDSGFSSHKVKK
ncbi:MAG: hypothetical protein K9N09_01735 [Candidatus Cloacimonetes bacterium]|nr:hypothetical protein [Candidatus Cloacimonadota bacterium]MCF7882829.1 hypothetical protein [Candidatus Cloacimonadota bacterium]